MIEKWKFTVKLKDVIKSRTLKKTYYAVGFIGTVVLVLAFLSWVVVRPRLGPVATPQVTPAFDSIVV